MMECIWKKDNLRIFTVFRTKYENSLTIRKGNVLWTFERADAMFRKIIFCSNPGSSVDQAARRGSGIAGQLFHLKI